MPFKKTMKTQPSDILAARGLMYHDWDAITLCQRQSTRRLGMTIQLEQESYMTQHPEITAMLELFVGKMVQKMKRRSGFLKEGVEFFTRQPQVLDQEIRQRLGIGPDEPYTQGRPSLFYDDKYLQKDLRDINLKFYPPEPLVLSTPELSTVDTVSSSFISIKTSDTTLPTPEPQPPPLPTLEDWFGTLIENTVDKAVYLHVDERALRYDCAYVAVALAAEAAMEIPVVEIREDIALLLFNAYHMFELTILEKERIVAEIEWDKRMRKKLKRTLRRYDNFRGWDTPPTPKSKASSHESYKKPPPRPCICHPQYRYNRYGKDRFGIYLPRDEKFCELNVTATPAISVESVIDEENVDDTKSVISTKSVAGATSSVTSKKSVAR